MNIADLLKIEHLSVTLDAPGLRLYFDDSSGEWVVARWGKTIYRKQPHWIEIKRTQDEAEACEAFRWQTTAQ